MIAQPVNTYDRQFDESEEAWVAFQKYRDHPSPRPDLATFRQVWPETLYSLRKWYTDHGWAARVLAWDQRVDQTRQAATLRGVEEMAQRHIGLAKLGLECVQAALAKVKADLGNEFNRLKPHEIARLLEVCAKLERLSRGEATERVDGEGVDYSGLTDAELEALEKISRKVR